MGDSYICQRNGTSTNEYVTINFDESDIVHSVATSLSEARSILAATTVGNYALFGGGNNGNGRSSTVDAYNASLTRSTPTVLSQARRELAATTVGDYALFGGGNYRNSDLVYVSSVVDAYNLRLTRSTPTSLSPERDDLAATSVGNYALFGGGLFGGNKDVVDAYNTSLTRSTPTALSQARDDLAATSIGDYALFGGGWRSNDASAPDPFATVDAYNTSLTRSTPTSLSVGRCVLAATSVGDYALFGGGSFDNYVSGRQSFDTVDAYNTSLTRSTPTALSQARDDLAATSVGNYALFGGGWAGSGSSTVDAYNLSLTRSTPTPLSEARSILAATSVGNYALFGGGWAGSDSSTVDAYTIVPSTEIQVYPETKYKFNSMQEEQTSSTWQSINVSLPLQGYIKVKSANIS